MGIAARHRPAAALAACLVLSGCQVELDSGDRVDWMLDDGGLPEADGAAELPADGALEEDPGADAGPDGEPDAAPDPEPDPPPPPPPDPEPDWSPTICPRVRVTTRGVPLNVRPAPNTRMEAIGSLDPGTIVDVHDAVHGQRIDGIDLWYEISAGRLRGFIYSGYAECTRDPATFGEMDGYYLPFRCGKRVRVSQGNNGAYSHRGLSAYAFDFAVGTGTRIRAMAAGVVIGVYNRTGPGHRCYNGGDSSCATHANRVVIRHADGRATQYGHLSEVRVRVRDSVRRGQLIGLSGNTGYSTGPHLHTQRQVICGSLSCQSVRLRFADVGVPRTGDTVTSGNCP